MDAQLLTDDRRHGVDVPVAVPRAGWSLHVPERLWTSLQDHLFPGGNDEHGAVILAGYSTGPRGPRLLARELLLAHDGEDYVPGQHGYRALRAEFVRDAAVRAREQKLAYIAVHNHRGTTRVGFSRTDLASHRRGYPALVQLIDGVVGGLVLARAAAAGDLWLPGGGRVELAELVVPGSNTLRLHSGPGISYTAATRPDSASMGSGTIPAADYDRQARMFGDRGQAILSTLRVGVVGLGGVGSVAVELLARVGIGSLLVVDPETVDATNLPRLLAAEPDDVERPKTELAARNAVRARPGMRVEVEQRDVTDPAVRRDLTRCDWIVLAADSHRARHWVNEISQRHLVPVIQAGVKIPVDERGEVGDIHCASRLLLPGAGCMWCNGLIDPTALAIELNPEAVTAASGYLDEVPAPSVITLNTTAASDATTALMMAATGLHQRSDGRDPAAITLHRPRRRELDLIDHRRDAACRWCSNDGGALAIGDDHVGHRSDAA